MKKTITENDVIKFKKEIGFIEHDGKWLLIEPDSSSWCVIDKSKRILIDKFNDLKKGMKYKYLNKNNIGNSDILSLYNSCMISINNDSVLPSTKLRYKFPEKPIVLLLTLCWNCNLQCKYCYANAPLNSNNKMTFEIAKKSILLMNKLNKKFRIIACNGEPLLNFSLIKEIIKFIETSNELSKSNISFAIQSNGTLLNKRMVSYLKEKNIDVGISIDGPKKIHNKYRIFPNGNGSFDTVKNNIDLLKNENKRFGVISVISDPNDFEEIISFFINESINGIRFNPVIPFGRSKIGITEDKLENYAIAHFGAFKKVLQYFKKTKELILLDNIIHLLSNILFWDRTYMCMRSPCGAANHLIHVNWNGDIYPCDSFAGYDNYKMGNILKIGSLENLISSSKIRKELNNRNVENITQCKSCLWKKFCGGGCPMESISKYNTLYHSSYLCKYYKKIYELLLWELIDNRDLILSYLLAGKGKKLK